MSQLPDRQQELKSINDSIIKGVASKFRAQAESDLQSELATEVLEETGLPKAYFKKLVAVRYQQETDSRAYEAAKETAAALFVENELLRGVNK